MFGTKLEKLLDTLFEDDVEPTSEVEILNWRTIPSTTFCACCTYSYGGYDG